jgi:hypothetical protein
MTAISPEKPVFQRVDTNGLPRNQHDLDEIMLSPDHDSLLIGSILEPTGTCKAFTHVLRDSTSKVQTIWPY